METMELRLIERFRDELYNKRGRDEKKEKDEGKKS